MSRGAPDKIDLPGEKLIINNSNDRTREEDTMKYSRYNITAKVSDSCYVLYNLLSEALIELDEENLAYFQRCLEPENEGDGRLTILHDNGFLIDDDYDEIDFLRYANKKYCSMNDVLQLTIAPTMDCNCKCAYCFEKPHAGKMTEETAEAVYQFIVSQHKAMRYRFIHVDWFGGEPMLCWDVIRDLSRRLIRFSEENGIAYSAGLITNGTIVTPELVREMREARISDIQITLDGDRETHDSRRMFRNDRGTFDVILNNLRHFIDSGMTVSIRVNIDRRNIGALEKVKEAVRAVNPQCRAYPAMVENFTDMAQEDLQSLMGSSEFSLAVKSKYLLVDIARDELPTRFISCQAQKLNSFGIDERGYLYKCWNELGMPELAFGTVFDYPGKVVGKNLVKFAGKDYLSHPECMACKVLPICMGGCAKLRQKNEELPCIAEKYCIEEYVVNIWREKISERKETSHEADQ